MQIISDPGGRRTALAKLNPLRVDAYHDKLDGWLRPPISDRTRARLSDLGAEFPDRAPKFGPSYWIAIHLHQPSPEALRLLGTLKYHHNYVECALDLVYHDQVQKDADRQLLDQHLIRRYHRREQGIRWVEGVTRYDAERGTANMTGIYGDKLSRISGELCTHIEWRCNGAAAMRRIGINLVTDLLTFNHREFWEQRFILREWNCDPKVLGRIYNRHVGPAGIGPRRGGKEWIEYIGTNQFAYSFDVIAGNIIQDTEHMPVQLALDRYRKLQIGRYLQPINVEHLFSGSHISDWETMLYNPTYPVNSKANSLNFS